MRLARFALPLALCVAATPLLAQSGGALKSMPSTRATTAVALSRGQGTPPLAIRIDYGQPHARGRDVPGTVDPYDKVWRLGANSSTTLTTDVDLTIGGVEVPKGKYSLYALPSKSGWKLIINKNTGQWGTEYDEKHDLARVNVRSRTLSSPLESFTMWLIPAAEQAPKGELRFGWGTMEFSTDWTAK